MTHPSCATRPIEKRCTECRRAYFRERKSVSRCRTKHATLYLPRVEVARREMRARQRERVQGQTATTLLAHARHLANRSGWPIALLRIQGRWTLIEPQAVDFYRKRHRECWKGTIEEDTTVEELAEAMLR